MWLCYLHTHTTISLSLTLSLSSLYYINLVAYYFLPNQPHRIHQRKHTCLLAPPQMTAWGSHPSPNSVHPSRKVLQVNKKGRRPLPLTLPLSVHETDKHHYPYLSRITRKFALGASVAVVTLVVFFFAGHNNINNNNNNPHASSSLLLLDADGFDPNKEFLTSEDYYADDPMDTRACYTAADCLAGSICAFPAETTIAFVFVVPMPCTWEVVVLVL